MEGEGKSTFKSLPWTLIILSLMKPCTTCAGWVQIFIHGILLTLHLKLGCPGQLEIAPRVISTVDDDCGTTILDTTSFAKQPGNDLRQLHEYLGNDLLEDFLAFYSKFSEALVVTRSYPVHLWSKAKMIEAAATHWRLWNLQKPIRFFRFGE